MIWNPTLTGNKKAEREGEAPFGTWRWTVVADGGGGANKDGGEGEEEGVEAKLVEKKTDEVILPRSLKMMESFC